LPLGGGGGGGGGGGAYHGEWKAGQYHGFGMEAFANGTRFIGSFAWGERSGIGRYMQTDGRQYGGQWSHGRRHGWGTQQMPEGTTYWGRFVDDVKEGPGVIRHPNGDVFMGCFDGGALHGPGAYWAAASRELSVGAWVRGELEGPGVVQESEGGSLVCEWEGGARSWQHPLADDAAPGGPVPAGTLRDARARREAGLLAAAVATRCIVHLSQASSISVDPALDMLIRTLRAGIISPGDVDRSPGLRGQLDQAPGPDFVARLQEVAENAVECAEHAVDIRSGVLSSGRFDAILREHGIAA